MKDKIAGFFKRYAALVIVLAILLTSGAAALIAFAEYTKSTRGKRVLRTGEADVLFSSNMLRPGDVMLNDRSINASIATESAAALITVCNYAQTDPDRVNEQNISYTLSAKLVVASESNKRDATAEDVDEGQTITLSLNGGADVVLSASRLSYSFTSLSLTGGEADSDELQLTFSPSLNNNETGLMVEITATPDSSLMLPNLGGLFVAAVATTYQPQTWTGRFTDNQRDGRVPADYNGFNYTISGYGAGSFTLKWNADRLNVDEVFWKTSFTPALTVNSTTEGGVNYKSVTFPVDSSDIDLYEVCFYYNNNTTFSSWADLTGCVTYTFTQS